MKNFHKEEEHSEEKYDPLRQAHIQYSTYLEIYSNTNAQQEKQLNEPAEIIQTVEYISEFQKPLLSENVTGVPQFQEINIITKPSILAKATDDLGLNLVYVEKHMMIRKMSHDSKLGPVNVLWQGEVDILAANGPALHIEIHDKRQARLIRTFDGINSKDSLEFDPNSETLKTLTPDGNIQYLDLGTGKVISSVSFFNCKI